MKRVLFFLVVLLLVPPLQGQTRADRFLQKYQTFVNQVVATPADDIHGDTLIHIQRQQKEYMRKYRWYYDKRLTSEQLEQYNRLCGRYHRKMRSVANRRRLAAVKGRLRGRFESPSHYSDTLTSSLQ